MEATGETVGEAKWAALRELEKQHPGLDKSAVHFQVVTEGERGLLGVGFAPAKVVATTSTDAVAGRRRRRVRTGSGGTCLVTRIVDGIGVTGRIDVDESDEIITVSCVGSDLGMLIGRHGQTIDAVQYLANAVMWRRHPEDRKEVVVDAAGYRDRRRVALEALALRAADRALSDHEPVELEPMTAVERKIVHLRLKELDGVETTSEGTEPNRYVVVHPAAEPSVRD